MKFFKINFLYFGLIFIIAGNISNAQAMGTRSLAMGEAYLGDYNYGDTVFYNPASLALQTKKYALVGGDISNISREVGGLNNYEALSAPLNGRTSLGLGMVIYKYNLPYIASINFGEGVVVSDISKVLDNQQIIIYNYATKWGKKPTGKINFGLNVYDIKRKLVATLKDGSEKIMLWSGLTIDAGVLLRPTKNFSVGFVAKNLNQVTILEPTEKTYSVGASLKNNLLTINADYVNINSKNNNSAQGNLRIGGEIKTSLGTKNKYYLALRGGMLEDDFYTFGLGIKIKNFIIEFAGLSPKKSTTTNKAVNYFSLQKLF